MIESIAHFHKQNLRLQEFAGACGCDFKYFLEIFNSDIAVRNWCVCETFMTGKLPNAIVFK